MARAKWSVVPEAEERGEDRQTGEEEKKREERKKNEKRAAKCGLRRRGEQGSRKGRKDGHNVYSVAVVFAAIRSFIPVVFATWAAMTRITK